MRIAGRLAAIEIVDREIDALETARMHDHDLNSFRLKLDPLAVVDGLRPGMTVWLAASGK